MTTHGNSLGAPVGVCLLQKIQREFNKIRRAKRAGESFGGILKKIQRKAGFPWKSIKDLQREFIRR